VYLTLAAHDSCLVQELLAKLEATETKLAQVELDLNSEQNVRRTLQSEAAEAKARLLTEAAEAKAREDGLMQRQVRDILSASIGLPLTTLGTTSFRLSAHRCRCRWLSCKKPIILPTTTMLIIASSKTSISPKRLQAARLWQMNSWFASENICDRNLKMPTHWTSLYEYIPTSKAWPTTS
jgi:hypothetical protein